MTTSGGALLPDWFLDLLSKASPPVREGFSARSREKQGLYVAELRDYREVLRENLGLGAAEVESALPRELAAYIKEDRYH